MMDWKWCLLVDCTTLQQASLDMAFEQHTTLVHDCKQQPGRALKRVAYHEKGFMRIR